METFRELFKKASNVSASFNPRTEKVEVLLEYDDYDKYLEVVVDMNYRYYPPEPSVGCPYREYVSWIEGIERASYWVGETNYQIEVKEFEWGLLYDTVRSAFEEELKKH